MTDYAIFMLDPNGLVTNWNAGAERIKGYTEAEIIGQHFSTLLYAGGPRTGLPTRALETAAARGPLRGRGLAGAQGRQPVLGAAW